MKALFQCLTKSRLPGRKVETGKKNFTGHFFNANAMLVRCKATSADCRHKGRHGRFCEKACAGCSQWTSFNLFPLKNASKGTSGRYHSVCKDCYRKRSAKSNARRTPTPLPRTAIDNSDVNLVAVLSGNRSMQPVDRPIAQQVIPSQSCSQASAFRQTQYDGADQLSSHEVHINCRGIRIVDSNMQTRLLQLKPTERMVQAAEPEAIAQREAIRTHTRSLKPL